MENNRILIDTSIVIDYLRKKNKAKSQFIKLFQKYELYISVISIFELYNGATTDSKRNDIKSVCNNIDIIDFDLSSAKLSSKIFRNLRDDNKLIEFRDILIGATALDNNMPIATLNEKHFNRIDKLEIL